MYTNTEEAQVALENARAIRQIIWEHRSGLKGIDYIAVLDELRDSHDVLERFIAQRLYKDRADKRARMTLEDIAESQGTGR